MMADQLRSEFLDAFRNNQVVIVVGAENSEKTTQVPRWCLEALRETSPSSGEAESVEGSRVACTQPKRGPAVSSATKVAEETGVALGEEIGYAIRFETRSGPKTVLKYVTDGLLLREAGADPSFESYGCVVLDEVQERTAATDTLMALLKQTLSKRADLKLVVMTEPADAGRFQSYFDSAPIVKVLGASDSTKTRDAPSTEQRTKIPEILRCDLRPVILQLRKIGVADLSSMNYIDPPSSVAVNEAQEALKLLGALDDCGNLTKIGDIMADFPLNPQLARALIASCDLHCSEEVRSIVAMLSLPAFAPVPAKTGAGKVELIQPEGDHLTLLNIYQAFKQSQDLSQFDSDSVNHQLLTRAEQVDLQLKTIMDLCNLAQKLTQPPTVDRSVNVRRALVAGCFLQVAYREQDAKYRTLRENKLVKLHPTTNVKGEPEWVIYNEVLESPENYIRTVTAIEPEWLLDLMPQALKESSLIHDEAKNRLEEIAARLKA